MIKDNSFQEIEIKRVVEGHTDPETGEWVESSEKLLATAEADIQPKTGRQQINEVQTEYESDHVAYMDILDIEVAEDALTLLGLAEFEESVSMTQRLQEKGDYVFNQGDTFIDEYDKEYTILNPGFWYGHFEMLLKAK